MSAKAKAYKRVVLTLEALDRSGVAYSAQNLVTGLLAHGVKVFVLALEGGEREEDFRRTGATVLVSRWAGLPLFGRSVFRKIREFRPDAVHAQSVGILHRTRPIAQAVNASLVVTANRFDDSTSDTLSEWPETGIVAVSEAIRERLANRGGIARDRIRVIPNGLDLKQFPVPSPDSAGERTHLPVVGTYGTLAEQKGQRVFLRAAAKVLQQGVDAEFLILGHGPDKPVLRNMAENLGITKRITFSPSTTTDALSLASLDLFVEPSFQEGLGLSVLQAMASGVPVLATGVGGIYTLIEDGATGVLVPRGDADALAEAICRLLADGALRRELSRHAREKVERDFDAHAIARRVLDFYAERSRESIPS